MKFILEFLKQSFYLFVFLLVIVWPMAHLIAVRNILIGLIFVNSFSLFILSKKKINITFEKYEKLIFILIFLFLGLSLFLSFISPFKEYCLKEYFHQFSMPLVLGISAFWIIKSDIKYKKIFEIIFWGMFLFVIYHVLYSFHFYLAHHRLPLRQYGITKGLDELNFMMPYVFAVFAVEFISRGLNKKNFFLKVSNPVLVFMLLISVFSIIVQDKRNGYISLIFLILSVSVFIYFYNTKKYNLKFFSKKFVLILTISIIISAALAYTDYKLDPRWKDFKRTYNIVFVQDNLDWYHHRIPKGTDDSTYRRMFYFKESFKFIKENPLGYGFGRNIFSKIASKKYHIHYVDHAHSGFLNILLGEGVIGFLIFSAFMFLLMYTGVKNFLLNESFFGLLLFYFSTSYYFRNFLDALFKNHYLEMFAFFVFLSFFAMKREVYEKNSSVKT
jgi:O-antigen ligase